MAVNLLQNMQNAINQMKGSSVQSSAPTDAVNAVNSLARAQAVMRSELLNMLPGATIQGKLVEQNGKNVQLLLSNTLLLNTQVDSNTNLETGTQMTFQVRSNTDGLLTLRPMFINTANTETITKALDAAGLPASDDNIHMVGELMEQGMPVNSKLLGTINREMIQYSNADISDIVMLHKMDIPVNEFTLQEMNLYKNNNQYIGDAVMQEAGELTELLTESAVAGDEASMKLIDDLKTLLAPENTHEESVANTEEIVANPSNVEESSKSQVTVESHITNGDELKRSGDIAVKEQAVEPKETETGKIIDKNNVFDSIKEMPPERLNSPIVKAQIKSAITELLKDNMLMKPEDVSDKKFVERFYNRLNKLTTDIQQALDTAGKQDSSFGRSNQNMQQNINFMNQINNLYNYVQLPLKMNQNQTNGDLYVYARKRNGQSADSDKLTALLHLSMEALGNMDVYLSLQEGKLSTNFHLEKEENIDFLEAHIDELNARLISKGYNIDTSVTKADSGDLGKNTIERIVGEEKVILLSTQSFDARA